MSLKAFHLIFVLSLLALLFGGAAWAFQSGNLLLGGLSAAGGGLVIIYGLYFLRKLKNISYL